MKMKIKQVSFGIGFLLILVMVSFLLVETSIRFLHLAPTFDAQYRKFVADPYLPYKPQPLSMVSGRSRTGEFDFEYKHNSLGFRDVEHPQSKSDDTLRILGLGDSFTYGSGARFEETYLYQLEQMLNARQGTHRKVEIIKAGIPSYFPEAERMLLDNYGRKYLPDVVLVGFLLNDVIDTHIGLEAITLDESGFLKTQEASEIGRMGTYLYLHSHFFRLLLRKYLDYKLNQTEPICEKELYKDNGCHEDDWQKVEAEFSKMISIAREWNAEIIFVYIPQQGPWDEQDFYPPKRLEKWCAEQGAGFINVLPAMMDAGTATDNLYYEKDGHCRPVGYAIIAKVIYEYLVKNSVKKASTISSDSKYETIS